MLVQAQHRFSVTDYYRMAETGVLKPGARVELLDGKIIDMSPIGPFHSGAVNRLIRLFGKMAGGRWLVSAQNPVHLDEFSEPQPDLMLLKPAADDYTSRHPRPDDVLLLDEVADTTLAFDREEKLRRYNDVLRADLPIYARAGISEVWILNLSARQIEIYREPHFTGYGSTRIRILRSGDFASPLAFPDVELGVTELLSLAK